MHPETIGELVRQYRADVGIALDGDADRVLFADSDGTTVDGDRILAMCAMDYMDRGKLAKDTLVVTAMSNLGLHEAMKAHGIAVEVTDVGDRYVIDRMRANGYNLGGEKSGHLVFMDYATTGDGILSALQVLKLMKQKDATVRQLADCMTEFPQRLVSIHVREKRPLETLPTVPGVIADCEEAFGDDGRVLVRYSGTESKVRLLVEARKAAAVEHWLRELTEAVRKDLG